MQTGKNNIWLIEIAMFTFLYSCFIESADVDDQWIYWSGNIDQQFFLENIPLLFLVTSFVTFYAAFRKKTSFIMYFITLSMTTLAAFARVDAYFVGSIKSNIWSIAIVWVHILLMQMILLLRYPVRDNRQELKEIFDGQSD